MSNNTVRHGVLTQQSSATSWSRDLYFMTTKYKVVTESHLPNIKNPAHLIKMHGFKELFFVITFLPQGCDRTHKRYYALDHTQLISGNQAAVHCRQEQYLPHWKTDHRR